MRLNDGIFHPGLNPGGWRCRWTGTINITWGVYDPAYPLEIAMDCFNPQWVYSGTDVSVRNVSGRPDGLILTEGTNVPTYNTEEW